MPRRPGTPSGFLLALVAAAAFGALPIFGKFALAEGFEVPTLLAWRFGLAAILLWGVVLLRKDAGTPGEEHPAKAAATIANRRRMALLGLGSLYGVNSGLYFLALERIPATTTSLVFYLYPAIVMLLGAAFLKRRVGRLEVVALALALVGVALTVGFAGRVDGSGVALALASAAVVSLYFLLGELVLAGLPLLPATALVMTGTALAYGAWEGATGGLGLPPTGRGWLIVAAMATFSTALSIMALLASISRTGAGTTSIVLTMELAVTAGLAALLLGESLAPRQYGGGALILGAVVLLRIASRRPAPMLADT